MKMVIGVTGGVGAGKSTVLNILKEEFHAHLIMADEIGRALMEPGRVCFGQIAEAFGEDMLKEDGKLDREKLSELVFQDQEKLRHLNGIVHPQVKKAVRQEIDRAAKDGTELIVIEAALLIEAGYRELCDELWYIYVPAQERVKRLYENRGYSEVKSYAIMSNQLSDSQFRRGCDFLVDNGRSLEETRQQIAKRLAEPKQQRSGQAPGGFPDASAAGNSPRARGLGREVAELKQQRTGQAPGGFPDASAAGNFPRARGLGREVAELNWNCGGRK